MKTYQFADQDGVDHYCGPKYFSIADFTVAAGIGSAQTTPITGYIDQIIFDNADSSDTFDLSITRELAGEVLYAKTALTGGSIVRPRALECKSEDGTALTTRCRIYLFKERVTVSVANATNGVVISAVIFAVPA